ncbi:uncharacterized protein LOC109139082 isoform X4 [Larimichthys crocea]|uniref:uncharacterized protein LOC109139082 isoform X4 n=1 Tax=Larimichthys crocea TaxID=215358 RepID=UPI000F5EF5F2|nr:uncharacterized protein LOC109139082 isoform X4 [Larimichthys crocea]
MNIGDTSDLKDEEKMDSKSMTVAHYACPNTLNLDSCSAGSSQTAVIDQNVGSSGDTKHQNDLDLKLWKLRANHIQRILSMPHQEHCPLDSYSRCKKLGIDFNVGSGMKQNLDPKLLTNGIMVELNTFATALLSAQKHFITDILEHNFDLNFENELSRSAFADDVMRKIQIVRLHKSNLCTRQHLVKRPFELPDVRCIEEPSHAKTLHCPKCYQDQKFHEDESDSGHMHHRCPHTMSDTVSADVKCTTQKHAKDASSTFSTTEETIMNSNPHCKKIGLNLCVDKDLPKDKLDMHVLTNSVMKEVVQFARRLCGTNNVIINDVLEHNFNIGKQSLDLNPAVLFSSRRKQNEPAWFNEVFVIQSYSIKPPGYIGKAKRESALHRSERMEVIRKRQLALQTKQERTNMPSGSGENPYPACTVIGLDLDVTSNSREKVILELKLLTRAVVFEMHKFATLEAVNYYPRTVFDILDYNFDLSSQHYRRWEFSIATALKIQTMVKEYCKKDDNTEGADEVFKLPFMLDPKTSRQRVIKRQNIKSTNSSMDTATESNSSCVDIHTHFLTSSNMLSSLATVNSNVTSKIGNQPDDRGFYGDEEQTQTPRNAPNEWNMEQEEIRTGNYYTCPLEESDLESDEVSDSENTGKQDHLRNPESFSPSSDIVSELKSSCMGIHAPLFTSTNHQSDIKQKEMETEHNMWKLRSNRVEQILSALTKDFGRFNRSKRVGLEYNVGFGPKQNISVESLKDSLLFEIGKFALAMNSSQKDFTMEILEYNFDVNLPSQHHRNIFASDIMSRVRHLRSYEVAVEFSNEVFELPRLVASINMTGQSEGCVNPELGMSNMGKCHVAPVCPPDSHAETKEHISCRSERLYPLCKEIGLNLHVNNSQPNKKMEINKLTNGAMTEVTNFAEKLCGTFEQICLDILRHNLDFDLQRDSELAKNILARIKTRKLALHSSQSPCQSVMKSKSNYSICFPLCSKIGLDLDVTSKSEEKEKLDLELLTTAVVAEIHKYISKKLRHYYPGTLFDILDYNFDLSSQHYRRWEFSLATAFEVQSMVKLYRKNKAGADEIFKLPFVFAPQKRKRTKCSMGEPEKKRTEGSCVHQVGHHSDVNHVSLLSGVQTKEETCSHDEDTKSLIDQWTMNIQNPGLVSVGCGSSLQVDVQIKKEEYDPHYADIKPEEVTGEKCHPQHVDVKTESVTGGVEHLVPYESPGSLGNTVNQNHLENTTSTDIPGQSESRLPVGCATFPTPTNVSSTLPNTNVNSPFTRGTDERELLKSSVDHWIMNVQNPGLVNTGCGSPLQENIQIKKEDYDPHYDKPEPDTEEKYHPQHVDVKAESNICDVEHLIPCEPAGSHGYAIITTHANSESNINTESENECFTESHIQIELDTPGINVIIIDESYENAFI